MGAAREPQEQQAVKIAQPKTEVQPKPAGPVLVRRPQLFERVPTHAVGVVRERRNEPRASMALPLRLTRIEGLTEAVPVTLVTKNISSSGVYFLAPRELPPGAAIELEVGLVDRPLGRGSVRMFTAAHVVRAEQSDTPGWHGYAATFDDFAFQRDEDVPERFLQR